MTYDLPPLDDDLADLLDRDRLAELSSVGCARARVRRHHEARGGGEAEPTAEPTATVPPPPSRAVTPVLTASWASSSWALVMGLVSSPKAPTVSPTSSEIVYVPVDVPIGYPVESNAPAPAEQGAARPPPPRPRLRRPAIGSRPSETCSTRPVWPSRAASRTRPGPRRPAQKGLPAGRARRGARGHRDRRSSTRAGTPRRGPEARRSSAGSRRAPCCARCARLCRPSETAVEKDRGHRRAVRGRPRDARRALRGCGMRGPYDRRWLERGRRERHVVGAAGRRAQHHLRQVLLKSLTKTPSAEGTEVNPQDHRRDVSRSRSTKRARTSSTTARSACEGATRSRARGRATAPASRSAPRSFGTACTPWSSATTSSPWPTSCRATRGVASPRRRPEPLLAVS